MAHTKEQFRNACSFLTESGTLTATHNLYLDANNLKVWNEEPTPQGEPDILTDITPDETTLNQALLDLQAKQVADDTIETIKNSAKSQIQNIPSWASWNEGQALGYIDTTVTDLASAKVVIRAMAQMLIAFRNELHPDLEGN